MICQEVRSLLAAYLDDALQPHDRALVESHLSTCEICQAERDAMAKTQGSIRQLMSAHLDSITPASDTWERLQTQLALSPAPAAAIEQPASRRSQPRPQRRIEEPPRQSRVLAI